MFLKCNEVYFVYCTKGTDFTKCMEMLVNCGTRYIILYILKMELVAEFDRIKKVKGQNIFTWADLRGKDFKFIYTGELKGKKDQIYLHRQA